MYEYNAKILNVVDGDTYDVDIDLGFYIHIKERVRVLNLDTPEKRGKEKELGLIVTDYAKQNFTGKDCVIKSICKIRAPKTDSFGRWLVHVVLDGDKSISEMFTEYGVNKYDASYSEDSVFKLKERII